MSRDPLVSRSRATGRSTQHIIVLIAVLAMRVAEETVLIKSIATQR